MLLFFFFFFNDTATTEIYTLSLHDALPIYPAHGFLDIAAGLQQQMIEQPPQAHLGQKLPDEIGIKIGDRKSTRLNSSHDQISYAVFCLKKKNNTQYWKQVTTTH